METPPRVAFIDIETAPHLGWSWEKWETDILEFKKQGYILSFSIKWQGKKQIKNYALPDYPLYRKDKEDDSSLVKELWGFFNKAEVIIAHNGDRFDIRKVNARLITHGFKPPSPYKTVDTLKIARKVADFPSNKLDDLAHDLGIGRKLPTTGKHLWFGCMAGVPSAWRKMRAYNSRDVLLLEGVYNKLRAWSPSHPDLTIKNGFMKLCPRCRSPRTQKRGFHYMRGSKGVLYQQQQFSCVSCGRWRYGIKVKAEPLGI